MLGSGIWFNGSLPCGLDEVFDINANAFHDLQVFPPADDLPVVLVFGNHDPLGVGKDPNYLFDSEIQQLCCLFLVVPKGIVNFL